MKIVTFTTDVRGTSFCAMKSLAGSLILRNEVYLFEFFAAFLNSSTNSDSVLVAPEQWLECQQKWRECSKPAAVPDVSTFMKEHFKFFSFARESSGLNDSTSDSQFQHTMEWAIGLTMTAADNSGRNGFLDAFCMGYLGKRAESEIFTQIRHCLSAFVVASWNDSSLRDNFIGCFSRFVCVDNKAFDLLGALKDICCNPPFVSFWKTEAFEVHYVGLALSCEINVLTLNSNGAVQQHKCGLVGSEIVVFVAASIKGEYFGLNVPRFGLSLSNAPSTSQLTCDDGWNCVGPSLPPRDNARHTSSTNADIRVYGSAMVTEDLSTWGKPPLQNSDVYLCGTWPETEALLRSVGLYHGIHTDAQSLQQFNWTHRVSECNL